MGNVYVPREHLEIAGEYLKTKKAEIVEKPWGIAILKPTRESHTYAPQIMIDGIALNLERTVRGVLEKRVLQERVAIIKENIKPRPHDEEDEEIIKNIGKTSIEYDCPYYSWTMHPEELARYSLRDTVGYEHGFKIEERKVGMLYIAKAVFPEWIDGNEFSNPETRKKRKR